MNESMRECTGEYVSGFSRYFCVHASCIAVSCPFEFIKKSVLLFFFFFLVMPDLRKGEQIIRLNKKYSEGRFRRPRTNHFNLLSSQLERGLLIFAFSASGVPKACCPRTFPRSEWSYCLWSPVSSSPCTVQTWGISLNIQGCTVSKHLDSCLNSIFAIYSSIMVASSLICKMMLMKYLFL